MGKIINSIKYLKISDFMAPLIFLCACFPALIFKIVNKIKKRRLWVVCESIDTARDNGYHFFKYIRENHNTDFCFYAIDKKAADYKKIAKYGNIIQYGRFKHWIYYMAADYNISTQKKGNPCQIFWYVIHVCFHMYNNRVFLQHGITKDDSPWLYYKNTRFSLFVCGAKKEHEYISKKFGYPEENVKYLGFPRFDNLYDESKGKNIILIMPTWRNWLGREMNKLGQSFEFKDTKYFNEWNGLLNDKNLISFIEKNNYMVYFYPHINMQKFKSEFSIVSDNIKIIDNSYKDIQELLREAKILITDFSSVFMDFAYMIKPMIFFQFDKEEYREKQYQQGYFDYEKNGFGDVYTNERNVIDKLVYYVNNDFTVEEKYRNNMNAFFINKDKNNCERLYNELKNKR